MNAAKMSWLGLVRTRASSHARTRHEKTTHTDTVLGRVRERAYNRVVDGTHANDNNSDDDDGGQANNRARPFTNEY